MNHLKMNADKLEVIAVWKTSIFKGIVLPMSDGVQLTLVDLFKNLGIILDPVLMLEKKVN